MPLLALLLAASAPPGDAPTVTVEAPPALQGALAVRVVDQIIDTNLGAVKACYSAALDEAPALQGRVVVDFVVLHDGSVRSATTHLSTVNQFRFEACVNQAFMSMSFPAPRTGKPATVRSALRFTAPASAPVASRG